MAAIVYAVQAVDDIERLGEFLLDTDPEAVMSTAQIIKDGLEVLERHPLIGRAATHAGMRELIISRGRSGYIALYSYDEDRDVVLVRAIRHQREAGFEE